jgi:hypothetical protein
MKPISIIFLVVAIAGCSDNGSKAVVLYKEEVKSGNSIVSLFNFNDKNGTNATEHCIELKNIYEKKFGTKYICSTIVFDEFKASLR